MQGVERDEPADETAAFFLQHADYDLATRVPQLPDASPCDFGERVLATDDNAWYLLLYDEIGAGRRFAVMGAGLQTDINCGTLQ